MVEQEMFYKVQFLVEICMGLFHLEVKEPLFVVEQDRVTLSLIFEVTIVTFVHIIFKHSFH